MLRCSSQRGRLFVSCRMGRYRFWIAGIAVESDARQRIGSVSRHCLCHIWSHISHTNPSPIVSCMTDEIEESVSVLHLSVDLNEVIQVSKREGAATGKDDRDGDCLALCQTSKECCFVWERDTIACQSTRSIKNCRLMSVVHPSSLFLSGRSKRFRR